MTLRTGASFTFRAQDREQALSAMRGMLAYLRPLHPNVSFRGFIDEQGDFVRLHLYQDADSDVHLAAVRKTTAEDDAFQSFDMAVTSLIIEAESQPYPYRELDSVPHSITSG